MGRSIIWQKIKRKCQTVNLYEAKTGVILKEHMVAENEGELTRVKEFLTPVFLQGRVFSADALHTQKLSCREIIAGGGDFLFFVKENQPSLHEDLRLFFQEPPLDCLDWRTDTSTDKGHGRLTTRFIQVSTELNDFLARDWHGVEQVFCLRRRVEHPLKCTQEYVSGITSLTPKQADPFRLLELVREQWSIENRLHWRRDVTLGEDACQTRTGSVPSLRAQLTSTVLSLMDRLGVGNVARQARFFDAHLEQAVQLLLTGYCSVF